jgi:hypothetical protein
VPVIASNRIGKEVFEESDITFYGGSFIAGDDAIINPHVEESSDSPDSKFKLHQNLALHHRSKIQTIL